MNIDNKTYLVFDKYAGNHNYNNSLTVDVTITDIFSNPLFVHLNNKEAIEHSAKIFNSGTYSLPKDLDLNFYDVNVFTITQKEIDCVVTLIGVNNDMIYNCVKNDKKIPNEDFLLSLCRYHIQYSRATSKNKVCTDGKSSLNVDDDDIIDYNVKNIIKRVMENVDHLSDSIIPDPEFVNVKLYNYQKRNAYWGNHHEISQNKITVNVNDKIFFGKVSFNMSGTQFSLENKSKDLVFYGGALIDEVGLGKTVQMATISLLNKDTNNEHLRPEITTNRICSKGTLIICPNHLCPQWKREFDKMINKNHNLKVILILTKVHYDKFTYEELCDADFVIVSTSFLDNNAFYKNWLTEISTTKTYHKSTNFDTNSVEKILNTHGGNLYKTPDMMKNTCANLLLINWHRLVVDEFHELYTVKKYAHMINILPLFRGNYRWCITGTPFEKDSNCLLKMIDFMTNYANTHQKSLLLCDNTVKYLSENCFRRNTKVSVEAEFKLPPLEEEVVMLKFTHTERMMYNAYLANPNNSKFSIFLRQLCCHPKLADEIKDMLSSCTTLSDIEKKMVSHYENVIKE
jgi:SNF2 family DNA or RNA helicase